MSADQNDHDWVQGRFDVRCLICGIWWGNWDGEEPCPASLTPEELAEHVGRPELAREFGVLEGRITIAEDFDEIPPEFEDDDDPRPSEGKLAVGPFPNQMTAA
jgi:hypothetical protein